MSGGEGSLDLEFSAWVNDALKPRATGRMIREDTFDAAAGSMRFLPDVLERQQNQKEFLISIWEYLGIAASEERIRNGRQVLRKYRDVFMAVERRYGVEPSVVAAIWGLETGYGRIRGDISVLSALATLAWKGRRAPFFEDELIAALRIIQSGHVQPSAMLGSWAGAMGHGQFMPSSFLDFAVDFDGDGRADIWADDPTDALASIGQYLAKHKWRSGQPWGFEVILPEGFDHALVGIDQSRATTEWADLGLLLPDGDGMPDYGPGSVLLPAGHNGVAIMALRNFHVIMRYNRAEAYAIGIGHLSDRLAGGKEFASEWPEDDVVLGRDALSEAQVLLTALGYSTQGVDGMRGPNTTRAVRAFQSDHGLIADGYLSGHLLEDLRARRSAQG